MTKEELQEIRNSLKACLDGAVFPTPCFHITLLLQHIDELEVKLNQANDGLISIAESGCEGDVGLAAHCADVPDFDMHNYCWPCRANQTLVKMGVSKLKE